VAHVVAGRVAVHSVEPPDAKVTVPVDTPGSPLSASVEPVPNATVAGVAVAVKDVAMATIRLVVVVKPP
jgi:hypothetical protein